LPKQKLNTSIHILSFWKYT